MKAPYPGRVKTRLGQAIGFEKAAQVYRCLTEDVLETVDGLGLPILIFFSPAQEEAVLKEWLGARSYCAQREGHLGERMVGAFRHCFDLGYEQVLILGSDCPDLPIVYLETALAALQQNQAVIGPSADGGYYTLGFTPSTFCPAVFGALPWSTPLVYDQTFRILEASACPVQVLPVWSDIDTLEDLRSFYFRHQHEGQGGHSLAYLRSHPEVFNVGDET